MKIRLLLKIMKLSIYGVFLQVFLLNLLLANDTSGQHNNVSVNEVFINIQLKDATLERVFKAIESKTDYNFNYDKFELNGKTKLDIRRKNVSVADVLMKVSEKARVKFKQVNKTINVDILEGTAPDKVEVVFEDLDISGKISDESGQGLPGASVIIKGTANGTTTNLDGEYKLTAPTDAILVISYVGYITQEIPVGNRNVIDLQMDLDAAQLEEIVVVGYGTQDKRDVTAAIVSLDEESIKRIPVASSVEAMQGQVSGVDILAAGGRPGQNPQINIRGRRSITASNDPLYVIDGIPQTSSTSSIFDINPQDIKSIEILKDAAATAIYGSRGANGVILITTKRGSSGKTVFTYDGFYGSSNATKKVDMMNGAEFAAMKRESKRSSWNGTIPSDDIVFDDPVELESLALGRSTDYQDLILGTGSRTNHQMSLSGGNDKTQFNISLGYYNDEGIIKNMDYQRITSRINIDHKVSNVFKAGISATMSHAIQNWGSSATMGESLANNPLGVPYDEEGNLRFLPTNDGIRTNPLNEVEDGAYIDERRFTRIFLPFYIEANIAEGLSYRVNFGPDIRYRRQGEFRGSLTNDNRGGPADAEIENNFDLGYTLENVVNYNKDFGDNSLKVTLLQSLQGSRSEMHKSEVANLPFETAQFYNIGRAEVKGNLSSDLEEWQLASFMGRVNYDIGGKYLFQASMRADGSSRLAEGEKWKVYPGFSAGWRVIDEGFMSEVKVLNELKLRASYGQVGNTSIDPYKTFGRLEPSTYAWDETPALGFALDEIPNALLTWEVSSTVDIGFDFGLFDSRLSGSIDWYRTNTKDALLNRTLPSTSGYTEVLQNIGSTRTTGVELGLNAIVMDKADGLKWNVDFNITSYKEEITELALKDESGNPIDDVGNKWFIGSPIRTFYDYRKIGIWQANEEALASSMENKSPGEIKLEDIDGDGVITPDDRQILGDDVPDFFGGITNRFNYRGFDLSFFFYYRVGHMIDSRFHDSNNSLFARYNNLNVDYWTIDNPTNAFPRPNENQERPRNDDTMRFFDGSYVKLRNVTIGYNFPTSVAEKLKMSSLRVYASAQNPWFSAKYDTFDPENNGDISGGDIPSSKVFLFGVNLRF